MDGAEVERRREAVLLPSVDKGEQCFFLEDHCANCLEPLVPWSIKLFCDDWCKDVAGDTRYARNAYMNHRIYDPLVFNAIQIRFAHNMSGGYDAAARVVPSSMRAAVTARDRGVCVVCGQPANQLDHINGADGTFENLQLMCDPCHRTKTSDSIVLAPPHVQHLWPSWWKLRVEPANPLLLADDQYQWKFIWQELKSERKQRLQSLPTPTEY